MKKVVLFIVCFTFVSGSYAQEKKNAKLPDVKIKKLDGTMIGSDELKNDGKPVIISFWATWCKPCIMELNAISENYADWQKETGVKLIAISVDDTRSVNNVGPFVNAKGWEYEIYTDANGDFKRAMNVNMVPHTFLLNANREIVDQHTSFSPGDEDALYEKVKKVAQGKSLE